MKESQKWTSKHARVNACVYEAVTADGMSEKGLFANLEYPAESEYPAAATGGGMELPKSLGFKAN